MQIIATKGSIVTLQYNEPTMNKGGVKPLADLNHTSPYMNVGNGYNKVRDINATSSAGGGVITTDIDTGIGQDMEADVSFYATATDNVGNESTPSISISVRIDLLAPDAPF